MNIKYAPLTPAELDELAEHMKYNPGLYGENVHRLLLSHQLLQASYQVSEDARAGHLKLIQDMTDNLKAGNANDGHHTHNELYTYRLLYNAYAALGMYAAGVTVTRSWKHHDGEDCFGGGWFIVVMHLPTGQVSNHYQAQHWDLFHEIPEVKTAPEWDGHTPEEAAQRLAGSVQDLRPWLLDLKHDAELLGRLEAAGVDNWSEYDAAVRGEH